MLPVMNSKEVNFFKQVLLPQTRPPSPFCRAKTQHAFLGISMLLNPGFVQKENLQRFKHTLGENDIGGNLGVIGHYKRVNANATEHPKRHENRSPSRATQTNHGVQ